MKLWPTGGLWRHPDFVKLWSAETVSQFGTQFTQLALPLVAIDVLHVERVRGRCAHDGGVPALPARQPAGRCLGRPPAPPPDPGRRRPLARRPACVRTDRELARPPDDAQLYIVGFLVGISTVFFDVAYQSYLPSLVERQQLIDGNAKLEISRAAAQIGGPGLAGIVIDFLKAPAALAFDAVSFVGSALFIFNIRKRETSVRTDAPRRRMREDLREGLQLGADAPVPEEHRRVHGPLQFLGQHGLRRPARLRTA